MPYDKLLEQRRIKSYRAKPREVEQLLQVAARDLVTAEKILPDDLGRHSRPWPLPEEPSWSRGHYH